MSRRKRRYENRQLKRKKKNELLEKYDNFDNMIKLSSLVKSARKASKGVMWKASTQRYIINILFRTWKTRQELIKGKDIRKGFIKFDLSDRGKVRHIQSVHFEERVVQKTFCTNAIYPIFSRKVIYDNYASQKGKGVHFALMRLEKQLRKFIKNKCKNKNKCNDGYVLTIDFKNYFGNINHEVLKNIYKRYITDNKILKLAYDFIDAFGDVGLGLGSEASQMNAVIFINDIDIYIKSKYKYYGRYMDDSWVLAETKEELIELLNHLRKEYKKIGIIVNENKTQITKYREVLHS